MRGVADEHDTAIVPLVGLEPFDRAAVDPLVALKSRQIISNQPAEPCEMATQAFAAAWHRVVDVRRRDIAKAIGAAAAHRTEPEKACVAQPELHAFEFAGMERRHAAPGHLAAVHR